MVSSFSLRSFPLTLHLDLARHLAGVFFRPSDVPQETTTSTRASRFSDGFFDKAPETTGSSVVGSTTITIDWRTLANRLYRVRTKEEMASASARENSIPWIIQTCRWKDDVRSEKHFNGRLWFSGIFARRQTLDTRGMRGVREKKGKDERSLRGESEGENVRNRRSRSEPYASQIVSYKSRNSLLPFATRTRKSEKCAPLM